MSPNHLLPPYEWRRLRGMLAERRIKMTRLAEAAGLNPVYLMRTLRGVSVPGELARIRLVRGLRVIGLPEAIPAVGLPATLPGEEEEVRDAQAAAS